MRTLVHRDLLVVHVCVCVCVRGVSGSLRFVKLNELVALCDV